MNKRFSLNLAEWHGVKYRGDCWQEKGGGEGTVRAGESGVSCSPNEEDAELLHPIKDWYER